MGGNVHDKGRAQFDADLRGRLAKLFSEHSMGLGWEKSETCFDCYVDTQTGKWEDWTNIIEDFQYDPATPYFNILVPTADTTRCNYMLELLMTNGHHVLLMAETGVGKSVIIQGFLNAQEATEKYVSVTTNYSAQTTPRNIVELLEDKLDKKRKNLLGP